MDGVPSIRNRMAQGVQSDLAAIASDARGKAGHEFRATWPATQNVLVSAVHGVVQR